MNWTREQLNDHIKAVKILEKIRDEVFQYIADNKNISEYDVSRYILNRFKFYDMKTWQEPIVAFGENTQYIHYFPSQYSKKIKPDSLILLDIWGRLKKKNAPFADLTFMAYYGKSIPTALNKCFQAVVNARDLTVIYLKNEFKKKITPIGKDVDSVARRWFSEIGYNDNFLHGLGHTLGLHNPHGIKNHFNQKNYHKIFIGTGYTVEPGIYFKNKFGFRSEINIFISKDKKLFLTSKPQKEISLIKI